MAQFHLETLGAFFSPLAEGDETPEFIRWAIEYSCKPRECFDGSDVEQLLRQLRPLAAVGEAWASNALIEGHLARAGDGLHVFEFDALDVLAYYGLKCVSEVPCRSCPANGEQACFPNCIGIMARSRNGAIDHFVTAIEQALKSTSSSYNLVPATNTSWYGLWAGGSLRGRRLVLTRDLVDEAVCRLDGTTRAITNLQMGLKVACELEAIFHVQTLPPGVIRGGRWELPAHCGYCGGVRLNLQRICNICGHTDYWKSPEKRHPLGIRPYRAVKMGS